MPPAPATICPQCGEDLPPGAPRFCIHCGAQLLPHAPDPDPPAPLLPATGATVKLANAGVPQEVIGGTVRLPVSGATPPGLWERDEPPGPADVIAIYPPLRAVRGGWSGLVGRGWEGAGHTGKGNDLIYHFHAPVRWFPAPGRGGGLTLLVEVIANSSATYGRQRRGFRFGLRRDGPMRVARATWFDAHERPLPQQPLPQIQIMAPPRIPRVSDLDETPLELDARSAAEWATGSQAHGAYRLYRDTLMQEHTPVGRGITLVPLREGREGGRPWWHRLLPGVIPQRFRARLERPFTCDLEEWPLRLESIRAEARGLGLDLDPAQAAEWWLDRYGYDGVVFTGAHKRYNAARVVIVFRRGQLARIVD